MINILIAGDFACFDRVAPLFNEKRFEEVLGQVKHYTRKMDYSIVNLEAPIVINKAVPIDKTGPNIKVNKSVVEALKYAGFNAVTLAHNHFYDYGEVGVADTLNTLDAYGVAHVGGHKNIEKAREIYYETIKDRRVAFLNFCESEYSIAAKDKGGSNPLNPVSNYYQIKEARTNADYVIIIVHGGHELYQLPSPRMKEVYRFFIDAGGDVVLNSHQHCFSGYEVYKSKPIFYGLGNFLFDFLPDRDTIWNYGYMVNLHMSDSISFEQIPYKQCGVTPSVEILKDRTVFDEKIQELNTVIADDSLLQKSFHAFVDKRQKQGLAILEPYNNRYLKALYVRRLLPSFVSKAKILSALNRVRAESLRDVFLQILENAKQQKR